MENNEYMPTETLREMILKLDNPKAVLSLVIKHSRDNIYDVLETLLEIKGIKKYKLATLCDMEKNYCYRLFSRGDNRIDRNKAILFGMALGLGEDEINQLLKSGRFLGLDSKDIWDSQIIWSLNNGKSIIETEEILKDRGLECLRTYIKD